jgi:hypothetical protein
VNQMDRSVLYERWLDDLQLYLNYKNDLDQKKRRLMESDPQIDNFEEPFWQEEDQLESLREISRRALDEYVRTAGDSDGQPS